jgi:microcystin-dependent protein
MTFWKWSRIASANATADSTCPFPEGMAPSAVNDGVRGAMAAVAKYRDDIAGATVTAGTNTAYTLSSYQLFDSLAHLDGAMIAFAPHATNGAGPVTLSVDSLGAKPLRSAPGVELLAAMIIQGTPYAATYNNTNGEWILHGLFGNPYNIPLLGGIDYWGTTAPNSSFIFPLGQALSRTTYAAAFAIMGTTYGSGDGSTTFNVPDKGGRVSAMKETSASRMTSTYFGGNSTLMGATGGGESQTLTLGHLPTGITSSGVNSISVQSVANIMGNGTQLHDGSGVGNVPGNGSFGSQQSIGSNNIQVTSNNTGGNPHVTVQPTIVCNYIMRII